MILKSIETGTLKIDGGAMFGIIPKVMWSKIVPADENNYTKWAMRSLFIDIGDRKILIDTGIGDKLDEKYKSRYMYDDDISLEKSLQQAGYTPEDITDVIHTHLHFDHVGGSVKIDTNGKLVPAFPNARYWIGKRHWESAMKPNYLEKASFLPENLLPLEENKVINFVEKEEEIIPGIYVKFYEGHTQGQMIPFINVDGHILVYGGDLFPSAAHVPAAWIMSYDLNHLQTLKEKEKFYEEAIDNDYVIFFEHDYTNECATLHTTDRGVRVKETFSLNIFLENIKKS